MILNCMLGTGFGGLEKLFLDEIEMLLQANMPVCGLVRKHAPLASYARDRNLPVEEIGTWSDWDPLSIARARHVVQSVAPGLVMCVGRGAHRLLARTVGRDIPIVVMVQKRKFDTGLPFAGVLAAATHRRLTLIEDGVPPGKIAVIPNAVRLPPQPKSDFALAARVRFVTLGRLHAKKGFGVLVDALGLLRQQGLEFQCAIAGEGPERQAMESRIDSVGLSERIRLPGWTDDVASFLVRGDIFVLPSFQEDFPLAVLDAMASGIPIVASAIDGPKDFLVDDRTALLVPPHDPTALAAALARLASDAGLRERLGRAARKQAQEQYSFEAVGGRFSTALRNVLAGLPISDGLD